MSWTWSVAHLCRSVPPKKCLKKNAVSYTSTKAPLSIGSCGKSDGLLDVKVNHEHAPDRKDTQTDRKRSKKLWSNLLWNCIIKTICCELNIYKPSQNPLPVILDVVLYVAEEFFHIKHFSLLCIVYFLQPWHSGAGEMFTLITALVSCKLPTFYLINQDNWICKGLMGNCSQNVHALLQSVGINNINSH